MYGRSLHPRVALLIFLGAFVLPLDVCVTYNPRTKTFPRIKFYLPAFQKKPPHPHPPSPPPSTPHPPPHHIQEMERSFFNEATLMWASPLAVTPNASPSFHSYELVSKLVPFSPVVSPSKIRSEQFGSELLPPIPLPELSVHHVPHDVHRSSPVLPQSLILLHQLKQCASDPHASIHTTLVHPTTLRRR